MESMMSADNFYVLRPVKNSPPGEDHWIVEMRFMSEDNLNLFENVLYGSQAVLFTSEAEAERWAHNEYAEYGVSDGPAAFYYPLGHNST